MTRFSLAGACIASCALSYTASALPADRPASDIVLPPTPKTALIPGCPRVNPNVTDGTLIDQLWKENCDLVNKFLNNAFSRAQAEQSAEGTLESFQYYSVQDYYYLLETAPQKAFLLKTSSPSDSEPDLVASFNSAVEGMREDLEYASEFRHNLTNLDHLGVPDDVVKRGYLQAAPLGYIKWLEENLESGWFALQVARIACIYGWSELAYQLDKLPTTKKSSKFYKEWITPNIQWGYGAHISEKIQKGVPTYVSKETFKNYNRIFREGMSFEIAFFESALGKTLDDVAGSK